MEGAGFRSQVVGFRKVSWAQTWGCAMPKGHADAFGLLSSASTRKHPRIFRH